MISQREFARRGIIARELQLIIGARPDTLIDNIS